MTPDELEAWNVVRSINTLWTSGRVDELGEYFHTRMVALTPSDRTRLEGRGACIESWRRFVAIAKILSWKDRDPKVEIHGDTAVVLYYYDLSCEMAGSRVELAGRDMFVLRREGGRWWVIADQFSPFPAR